MKRFTKRTAMLLVAMLVLGSVLVRAEKRYVFALGDFPITDPGWGAGWVDMRLDDISRTLYIWPDGTTLAGTPAVGTGSLGQANYTAFTVGNAGWWGCGFFVSPAANLNATMDLTDVTMDWILHFAIRTDCATNITINLNGSPVNPTDALDTQVSGGKYDLTTTNLPLAKRDKTTWTEFNVKLSDFVTTYDQAGKPLPALVYKGLLKKQNYLTFAGGNDTGSFIAWDNVYLTNGAVAGVASIKADKLDLTINGNTLKITNNTNPVEIYSISGARVISSRLNEINISGLSSGMYVVKAGNKVNKFNK